MVAASRGWSLAFGQAMDQMRLNGHHHGQVDPGDGDGGRRRGQHAMSQNDRRRAALVHFAQQFMQRLHLQQRLPIGGRQMIEDRLLQPLAAEIGCGKPLARRRQVDGNGLVEQAVEPRVMGLEATPEILGKRRGKWPGARNRTDRDRAVADRDTHRAGR